MFKAIPVVVVVAMEKSSRAIGDQDTLLWHIPADLKRFKQLTLGHPIIMGRKTFASIVKLLGKPLPDRTNIVLTRYPNYSYPGVAVAHSLDEAFAIAATEEPTEIHIGGGTTIYEQALPHVDRLHVTLVDDPGVPADTIFPDFAADFRIAQVYPEAEHNDLKYQCVDFVRLNEAD